MSLQSCQFKGCWLCSVLDTDPKYLNYLKEHLFLSYLENWKASWKQSVWPLVRPEKHIQYGSGGMTATDNISHSCFANIYLHTLLCQALLIFSNICADFSDYNASFLQRSSPSCRTPWPLNVSRWTGTKWMYVCLDISLILSVCFW